jgi:KGK domain
MNCQSKQLISDVDTVICLSDEAIIESLKYHDTYKAKSLLNQLCKFNYGESIVTSLLEEVLEKVYHNQSNISNSTLATKIQEFIRKNKSANCNNADQSSIQPFFAEGVKCNLLQPNGKGWQKGTLKVCFEFTPEEDEPMQTKGNSVTTEYSSLDEIRQLANNSLIEQN